jgi:hypothetical protein
MDKNTTFTVASANQSPVELVNDASAPSWDDFLASGWQRSKETAHDNEEVETQEPQSSTF